MEKEASFLFAATAAFMILTVLVLMPTPAFAGDAESLLNSYVHDTSLTVKGKWIMDYFHNDTRIYSLARIAAGGNDTASNYEKAKRINSYISSKRDYDETSKYWFSDVDMAASADWGASLFHGVCLDFAALEVSMLRSLGIPSRVIYADFDLEIEKGHAWVEFWDDAHGWVPSDPTFGTFDLAKYYCYLGHDVSNVHTVLNSTNVPVTPGSRYSECTKQSQYIDLIILFPITVAVLFAGIILFRDYMTGLSESEDETAGDEGIQGELIIDEEPQQEERKAGGKKYHHDEIHGRGKA